MLKTTLFALSTLLLIVLTGPAGLAQDSTIQYRSPRVILKLAPLSLLLDPDATIQAGLEIRTGPRTSVQGEVGFGHKGFAVVPDEKQNMADWSIWRGRAEWRHYTNHYRTNRQKNIHIQSRYPLGNYVAIEGFGKQINATKNLVLYDNIGLGTGPSQQTINRFVGGSHLKWGRQIAIPGQSLTNLSRVLLDFYIGIGVRYGNTQADPTILSCGCGLSPFPNRFQRGHAFEPSVAAGMKIGLGL